MGGFDDPNFWIALDEIKEGNRLRGTIDKWRAYAAELEADYDREVRLRQALARHVTGQNAQIEMLVQAIARLGDPEGVLRAKMAINPRTMMPEAPRPCIVPLVMPRMGKSNYGIHWVFVWESNLFAKEKEPLVEPGQILGHVVPTMSPGHVTMSIALKEEGVAITAPIAGRLSKVYESGNGIQAGQAFGAIAGAVWAAKNRYEVSFDGVDCPVTQAYNAAVKDGQWSHDNVPVMATLVLAGVSGKIAADAVASVCKKHGLFEKSKTTYQELAKELGLEMLNSHGLKAQAIAMKKALEEAGAGTELFERVDETFKSGRNAGKKKYRLTKIYDDAFDKRAAQLGIDNPEDKRP